MSVKIKGTFRVVNCRFSYEFGISELLLRTNESFYISALYTYNIPVVKKTLINTSHVSHAYN